MSPETEAGVLILSLAATAVLFLVLSVFQCAAATRAADDEPPPPARLLAAVRATRHLLLVAGTLLSAQILGDSGVRLALPAAGLLVGAVFVLGLDQWVSRAIVILAGERALEATHRPAILLSAPVGLLLAPARRVLHALWKALGAQRATASGERPPALPDFDAEPVIPDPQEGELLSNVSVFGDTVVREIMTPRTEMVTIEEGASLADLIGLIRSRNRSRIPVTRGGADHVVGMVHARDLLNRWADPPRDRGFGDITRSVMAVPESKRAQPLLREMQSVGAQMAIVVDEYGGTAGLVTIEDLLEELVGEIADEHEGAPPALLAIEGGAYLVPATYPLYDLCERLGVPIPEVEADTVGGVVTATLGRLPERGESVILPGLRLTVAEADRRRVRRVRVEPVEVSDENEEVPPAGKGAERRT